MFMSSQFLYRERELQAPVEPGLFAPTIFFIPVLICFGPKQIEVSLKVATICKS
jgi:hypothetical protein